MKKKKKHDNNNHSHSNDNNTRKQQLQTKINSSLPSHTPPHTLHQKEGRNKPKNLRQISRRKRGQLLFVGCLTPRQHASVFQGRICSDNCTCCHTEIEVADPTFYLTQSQYTDTEQTSPSADHMTPGAWQGSHWSANFEVTGLTRLGKILS